MSLFVSWVLVLSFMLLQLHTTEFLAPLILISVWLFQLLVSFFISQSDKGEHEGDTLPSRPLFNHLLCVISSISWFVLSYKVTNERKKRWTQTSQKNPTSFSLSSSKEINKQKNMSSRSNDLFFFLLPFASFSILIWKHHQLCRLHFSCLLFISNYRRSKLFLMSSTWFILCALNGKRWEEQQWQKHQKTHIKKVMGSNVVILP